MPCQPSMNHFPVNYFFYPAAATSCLYILLYPFHLFFLVQLDAIHALRYSAEEYLANLLCDAQLCTFHAKRVTVLPKDLTLARALRLSVNWATQGEVPKASSLWLASEYTRARLAAEEAAEARRQAMMQQADARQVSMVELPVLCFVFSTICLCSFYFL